MFSFLICSIFEDMLAAMVLGFCGLVLVISSICVIVFLVVGADPSAQGFNLVYLILNVINVNAAKSMVTIQKRMVIFTSWWTTLWPSPYPLKVTVELGHAFLKSL